VELALHFTVFDSTSLNHYLNIILWLPTKKAQEKAREAVI